MSYIEDHPDNLRPAVTSPQHEAILEANEEDEEPAKIMI